MFWFIAIVILLVILWPYVLPLLAPVGTFLVVIASAPVVWTLKLIAGLRPRRKKTNRPMMHPKEVSLSCVW